MKPSTFSVMILLAVSWLLAGFVGCGVGVANERERVGGIDKPVTTQEFIDVCLQTGGSPRVVEADVDGMVMNCLYPDDILDYEETRDRSEA